MSEQVPTNDSSIDSTASALSAELERVAWTHFSKRYHDAQRDELDWYPKLAAAWSEWQAAWALATSYERASCTGPFDAVVGRHG